MRKAIVKGAAVVAALAAAGVLFRFFPRATNESPIVDIKTEITANLPNVILTPAEDIAVLAPTFAPAGQEGQETVAAETEPSSEPKRDNGALFTMTILKENISVAHGVQESTLRKTPGWLPTSALPGQDGMCVVYGHRNRSHLRVLEKVELGDAIVVTMQDGTKYTYLVCSIELHENAADFILPVVEGKSLVLATCYPFRYSGGAPGKCVVTAALTSGTN